MVKEIIFFRSDLLGANSIGLYNAKLDSSWRTFPLLARGCESNSVWSVCRRQLVQESSFLHVLCQCWMDRKACCMRQAGWMCICVPLKGLQQHATVTLRKTVVVDQNAQSKFLRELAVKLRPCCLWDVCFKHSQLVAVFQAILMHRDGNKIELTWSQSALSVLLIWGWIGSFYIDVRICDNTANRECAAV